MVRRRWNLSVQLDLIRSFIGSYTFQLVIASANPVTLTRD
jgi:hypothetical protein